MLRLGRGARLRQDPVARPRLRSGSSASQRAGSGEGGHGATMACLFVLREVWAIACDGQPQKTREVWAMASYGQPP